MAPGRIQPHDAPLFIDDQQPAPHVHGGGSDHLPPLDKGELGGAAADVDVEYAFSRVMRYASGPRTEGRQHRFHVVAGCGADEFPALLGKNACDGFGVFAPQSFAGEDHDPCVDVVRVQPGVGESPVDDGSQLSIVDELLAPIRGQRDRGLKERLPGNNEVTARKLLSHSPQVDAGKNDLRPRRADIDSDAEQRDMILDPQGIVLETAVRLVVIVVVVGRFVSVMAMIVLAAVKMVFQIVRALRVRVVRHRSESSGKISIYTGPSLSRSRQSRYSCPAHCRHSCRCWGQPSPGRYSRRRTSWQASPHTDRPTASG